MMVNFAQKGLMVVRLKGGDPIVFGRGGEEAEVLRKHNIPFEIVPGIYQRDSSTGLCGYPSNSSRHIPPCDDCDGDNGFA